MTIFSFLGIFAELVLGNIHVSYQAATLLTIGVFLGLLLWRLMLCDGVAVFHARINQAVCIWINACQD